MYIYTYILPMCNTVPIYVYIYVYNDCNVSNKALGPKFNVKVIRPFFFRDAKARWIPISVHQKLSFRLGYRPRTAT